MVDLLFVEPGDEASPQVFDGMFALRHRVFGERLGWDVNSVAGREHDLYDDLHPVYLVCRDDKQTVGWLAASADDRAIHAQGCLQRPPPRPPASREDLKVWEISRFALQPTVKGYNSLAGVSQLTGRMFAALFAFGLEQGIRQIVGVTDVRCERVLARTGVDIQRFGPPRRIGRTRAVAGSLDVDSANLERVSSHVRD